MAKANRNRVPCRRAGERGEEHAFDALTKALAPCTSRRKMLQLLGQGGASALLLSLLGPTKAFAAPRCKGEGESCSQGGDAVCCSGYCNRDGTGRAYCRDARTRPPAKPTPTCKPSPLPFVKGDRDYSCKENAECCSQVCRRLKLTPDQIKKYRLKPEEVAALEDSDLECRCLAVGEACTSDVNCCSDSFHRCRGGVCVDTRPPCVPIGGVCRGSVDCCNAYCDNPQGGTGHCREIEPCVQRGGECRPDLDCCPGTDCHKGVCV
jgi:hypothetical protein